MPDSIMESGIEKSKAKQGGKDTMGRKKHRQIFWVMLIVIMVMLAGCSGSGGGSLDDAAKNAVNRFSDSSDISEFVAIGMDGSQQMAEDGDLEGSESGLRFTADGLDVSFSADGKLLSVTASAKPYNLYGIGIGDSFDIFDDGKEFTKLNMSLIYEDEDAIVYAVTDSEAVGGDRAVTIALDGGKVATILYEMSGGAHYAELYAGLGEMDENYADMGGDDDVQAEVSGDLESITDAAALRFLESWDASEFLVISTDAAMQIAGAGYLEARQSEYGPLFGVEDGVVVLYGYDGNLDTIIVTAEPYNFCGVQINGSFDRFAQGRVFINSGMELAYDSPDSVLYETTDGIGEDDQRYVLITMEEGAVSVIVYAVCGGYGYTEMIEGLLQTAAADTTGSVPNDSPAASVSDNYRPGMKVDGIYAFDNGSDAICTADVNFSGNYISVECTSYSGRGLYAYESWDCQENDTGDYTVSNEFGSYLITFTDGGLYMDYLGDDESDPGHRIEGYYYLSEPYNASLTAGIDFTASYIFPDSSQRLLTQADLNSVGAVAFLRYAKNEIYARHGRLFTSDDLDAYFHSKRWYAGTIAPEQFNEASLSEIEKANVTYIQEYMDQWY